ncbi:PD-(D/E)XK nuclease family protein [Candidatus Kinetoplastidibacterium galati]|uniref:RecB family exonuclease n=1 Tax=Candidatus Kinetoplastidibacterium galati TCC219 TaxID=1208921 RepID=M1LXR5_9PROT|nr:PD-(D/E)XK nuclease family protein [Candidatus Kinetoplastibacterium galatii]AGF48856.1 RecB family exonuclease [Candidatus Kinetoplastibacterium galatii TCC219]
MHIEKELDLCEINLESVCSMAPRKSLLLTANKRQANQAMKHLSEYLCSSKETKELLQIISIDEWIINLFENLSFLPNINIPTFFLNKPCLQVLWHSILTRNINKDSYSIGNKKSSALALDAYNLIKNWKIKLPKNLADYENSSFVYWKKYYEKETKRINAIDINGVYSLVIKNINRNKISLPENIILSGFLENYPRLDDLLRKLISKKVKIYLLSNKIDKLTSNKYLKCDNITEEWRSAVNWITDSFIRNPSGKYAIASAHLDKQAEVAYRMLDHKLRCYKEEISITFSISCEKSIAHSPIIHSAFSWLNILFNLSVSRKCDTKNFGKALLSSCSFMGNKLFEPYSVLELKLRDKIGIYIDIIEISELLADYDLGADLIDALSFWPERDNLLQISKWILIIRKSLFFICFSRYASSDIIVHEAVKLFDKLLNEFNVLSPFFGDISAARVISLFEHFVESNKFYKNDNRHKNIEVLDLKDVISRNWDAVWVIDFNDEIFQYPIHSNPFLPKNILHEFSIAKPIFRNELNLSCYAYKSLNQCTRQLVVSYSSQEDYDSVQPSKFIDDSYQILNYVNNYCSLKRKVNMECINDSKGPRLLTSESVINGTGVLELQSRNPLWAFAKYRLGIVGLDPYYKDKRISYRRGRFLHRILELFWLDVRYHSKLMSLSDMEIDSLLLKHIKNALSVDFYLDLGFIKQLESERALKILKNWINTEKNRLPFLASSLEYKFSWEYKSLVFNMRSDRIDFLENKAVIIDYKTGNRIFNIDLDWSRQRPINLQMLVYNMAFSQTSNLNIMSLIIVLLNPKGVITSGVSSDDIGLTGIKIYSDFSKRINELSKKVSMLADEYIEGVSDNSIVKKDDLRFCDIMPFLRINFNE